MDKETDHDSGHVEAESKKTVMVKDEESDSEPKLEKKAARFANLIQYPREKLIELSKTPPGMKRPTHLSKDYDTSEGLWDPERWFRSFDGSRGSSPLTFGGRDRKRPAELDRDSLFKRRPSDPKARIKEEEDNLGIVLSPQRRSFGTGCHVTQTSTSSRRPGSPLDSDRDSRERRGDRRIGSGRIQIDRDRDRNDRFERGRFDRDERGRFDRGFSRRDERLGRDDRRYHLRHEPEAEPEWFTGGPSSQSETIELHGFEKSDSDKSEVDGEEEQTEENNSKPSSRSGSHTVVDRNGSLETNESSSPEASQNSEPEVQHSPAQATNTPQFDFNDFFKIDNIPGLVMVDGPSPEPDPNTGGSRFSRWFFPVGSQGNSKNNSRRSSINDEFGILTELIGSGGNRSPVIPSPTQISGRAFSPMLTAVSPDELKQQQHILDMLHNSSRMNMQPLLNSMVTAGATHTATQPHPLQQQHRSHQPKPANFIRKLSLRSLSSTVYI